MAVRRRDSQCNWSRYLVLLTHGLKKAFDFDRWVDMLWALKISFHVPTYFMQINTFTSGTAHRLFLDLISGMYSTTVFSGLPCWCCHCTTCSASAEFGSNQEVDLEGYPNVGWKSGNWDATFCEIPVSYIDSVLSFGEQLRNTSDKSTGASFSRLMANFGGPCSGLPWLLMSSINSFLMYGGLWSRP